MKRGKGKGKGDKWIGVGELQTLVLGEVRVEGRGYWG
jgi:hypothetical protein